MLMALSSNLCCIILFVLCLAYRAETVAKGALRFYRNGYITTAQAWSSGIVQIYYSGDWGNICDDFDFGQTEATVICHQFGYSGASSYTNTGYSSLYGIDTRNAALDDVSCSSSSYLTITQCTFSTYISYFCTDSKDAIVTCYSTRIWNSPTTGDIRLTGGTYSNEGLLEVYCNGQWGTVCDDTFGSTEARVACRQLGYNDYYNYEHLSQQGSFSQSIWLDALYSCSSFSSCLTSCQACPLSADNNCFHFEDVTLECEYSSSRSRVYTDVGDLCDFSDMTTDTTTGSSAATIAAAVVGSIILLVICILIFTVPFCICCCLGVGVGAASRSRPRRTIVTNTASPAATTAVVTTTQETVSEQPAYPQQPAAAYPAPPPAYGQDPPKEYPLQAGYPQQGGYPPQAYPVEGYPSNKQ